MAGLRPDLVRTLTLISPALPLLDFRRSLQGRMLPVLAIPRAVVGLLAETGDTVGRSDLAS